MNRLSPDKRRQIVAGLVEGSSIRATCRTTGAAKNTVVKLLRDLGIVCANYHDRVMRNLPCKRLRCDETWSFCYCKKKNIPLDKMMDPGVGDVWTWLALQADGASDSFRRPGEIAAAALLETPRCRGGPHADPPRWSRRRDVTGGRVGIVGWYPLDL